MVDAGEIWIVDDEAPLRDSLSLLCESRKMKCRAFSSAEDFLAANLSAKQLACLILDVRMKNMSGIELFQHLQQQNTPWPVIFLTGHGEVALAVNAIQQGAFDFVEKPFNTNQLIDRAQAALQLCQQKIAARAQALWLQRALGSLSSREREVLDFITRGIQNKVIAQDLGITIRTVEVHRAKVFEKMGVKSAVELVNRLNQANH